MTGTQATLSAYDDPRPTTEDLERLGRVDRTVLRTLREAGDWVDRMELVLATDGAVIHSSISRLRRRYGFDIESRRDPEAPGSGNWQYRLNNPDGVYLEGPGGDRA